MKRALVIASLLFVLGSGAVLVWQYRPIRNTFYTDADSIREPLGKVAPRDILWQPPVELPKQINSDADDYEPRMSADGLTLYFVRGKAGRNADIFVSTRSVRGWSEPEALSEVNSAADDLGPEPAADGETLYFYSNRDGGAGGYDLWVARRGDDGWHSPVNLGPAVNTEYNDYGPAVSPSGKTLYFASNRPAASDAKQPDPNAWTATLREDLFHRTYDLYSAEFTDAGLQPAAPLSGLNTTSNEGAPSVSPFGDFLYFASDRPGGEGGFDLYRARRLRGLFQTPVNLGATLNTPANELDPGLSLGGYRLDFSSDRRAEGADGTAPREYNIYQTTSREVFSESEELSRASIDWMGLWRAIGPNLLWALLALLLLLAMIRLVGGMRHRRLSLIMKCLLASLAAHLLLMLLFNTMEVASTIAGELGKGRKGPIQIALTPGGGGQSITAQIRGGIGEMSASSPPPAMASMLMPAPLTVETPNATPVPFAAPPASTVRADLPDAVVSARDAAALPRIALTAVRTIDPPKQTSGLEFPEMETAEPIRRGDAAEAVPTPASSMVRAASPIADAPIAARMDITTPGATRIAAAPQAPIVRSAEAAVSRTVVFPAGGTSVSSLIGSPAKFESSPLETGSPVQVGETSFAAPVSASAPGVQAKLGSAVTKTTEPGSGGLIALPRASGSSTGGSLAGGVSISDTPAGRIAVFAGAASRSDVQAGIVGARPDIPLSEPGEKLQPFGGAEGGTGVGVPGPVGSTTGRAALASDFAPAGAGSRVELALPSGEGRGTGSGPSLAGSASVGDAPIDRTGGTLASGPSTVKLKHPGELEVSVGLPKADAPVAARIDVGPNKGATFAPTASNPIPVSTPAVTGLVASSHSRPLPVPAGSSAMSPSVGPPVLGSMPSSGSPVVRASNLGTSPNFHAKPGAATVELSLPSELQPPDDAAREQVAGDTLDSDDRAKGGAKTGRSLDPSTDEVLGVIRGKVTDAQTRLPIGQAAVRLDLPDRSAVAAITGPDGSYVLYTPQVPDFFALSASIEGFVPKSVNVERARLVGRTIVQDFALERATSAILATEAVPDVHHLGDNRFDGTINSQFQKQSEGSEFTIHFDLSESQLPPKFNRAQVRLMAKGVQRNHRIVINDNTLSRRLNQAPEDGSFGEFRASFEPSILRAGRNTLQIIAAPSSDDIDDFEFVNVQVRLAP